MDRVTDLLSSIPGYDGYRDKENRRETDRRVRERISRRLGDIAREVEAVAADLAARREISSVGPVDRVAKSVRHLQNLVSTATYGYGGLYSDRNVDEVALDQLNQFDSDLLTRIETLEPLVKKLKPATPAADRESALSEITGAVEGLQTRFEERSTVVETGRPTARSTSTSPLTVLDTEPTQPLTPAPMTLHQGDALSVSGENFVVDAVIEIEAEQPMRLVRIGVAPDRWLLMNPRFVADVTPATINETGDSAGIDGETLPLHGSGSSGASVTGLGGTSATRAVSWRVYGGSTELGPVAITLDWSNAQLQLAGAGIPYDDIDVFGKPSAG